MTQYHRQTLLICLILAAATAVSYRHALEAEFIRGDDEHYVIRNPAVLSGLNGESIAWAFRPQGHSANWHPLTWISHMTDVELFGPNPAGHHAVNVLFHILNTVLLFLVLGMATGSRWRSALVAALFALHPLHVESVAWISERKDVLSTFFWMLTLGAYVLYARKRNLLRYLAVVLFLGLGLLAKTMLVTLPCVLLLLDFWPLRRTDPGNKGTWPRLILEKTPLFALALASSVMTFVTQRGSGAVNALDELPLAVRLGNAVASYGAYIGQMFFPVGLSAYYPHPGEDLPLGTVLAGAGCLVAGTLLVLWKRRERFLAVGWLWYLGTLVPVIGLIQVGSQARADRYTYIPLIGLFLMLVWGGHAVAAKLLATRSPRWRRNLAAGPIAVILILLAVQTSIHVGYWRNSVTLFAHALSVTEGNHFAETNLAQGLNDQGRYAEAARHYAAAIAINPGWAEGYINLANAQVKTGKYAEAIRNFNLALERIRSQPRPPGDTREAVVRYGLGLALDQSGKPAEARKHLEESLRTEPNFIAARYALGTVQEKLGDYAGAVENYRAVLREDPSMVPAHNNLAVALFRSGDYAGAWKSVAACRALGHEPAEGFLRALSREMPEPGK